MSEASVIAVAHSTGNSASFERQGYAILDRLCSEIECHALDAELETVSPLSAGVRNLLDASWCMALACKLRARLHEVLPASSAAVQCTLFEKSARTNWLVPPHQDLSIPVRERIDHPTLSGWSEKEGALYVQPPVSVLEQLVAVRFHLDDCGDEDGPLKVVAGSHRLGRLPQEKALEMKESLGEQTCCVGRGGALLMRPLLLHASSKSAGRGRRRVLHFVYGPPSLPFGLAWRHAV